MENETTAGEACGFSADFQYSLLPITYAIVFVLGLLENGAALYFLACRVSNPPRSYVFLINLAAVDTLFVCVLPFKIHYHLRRNHWVFGDGACRVTGSMFFLNIYLSIAFFTAICVDRYVAILRPFAYARVRRAHYSLASLLLWAAALSIAGPLVLGGPLDANRSHARVCFESFGEAAWNGSGRMVPYNVCALVFGFAVPFVVILISYPLIARRISHIPASACRQKALSTIYLILFICVTCFLPFHLTHLLHFLMRAGLIRNCRFATSIYKLRRVTLALVSVNCCLNPFLYYFTSASKWCHWPCHCRKKTVRLSALLGEAKEAAPPEAPLGDLGIKGATEQPPANEALLVMPQGSVGLSMQATLCRKPLASCGDLMPLKATCWEPVSRASNAVSCSWDSLGGQWATGNRVLD